MGTMHAVWCCREALDGVPFVTVNAVIGYDLIATRSEKGVVNRGVCVVDAQGRLAHIDELKRVRRADHSCECQRAAGREWAPIPQRTCWREKRARCVCSSPGTVGSQDPPGGQGKGEPRGLGPGSGRPVFRSGL